MSLIIAKYIFTLQNCDIGPHETINFFCITIGRKLKTGYVLVGHLYIDIQYDTSGGKLAASIGLLCVEPHLHFANINKSSQ